ncbi:hypothetical protein LTR70_004491 [Exophiala xenobiotica]|uniref:Uncharacterized protein n=1 Tax=Lithohypha guttulata TaxID=1690604 RepID=A0ABR0KP21_9EURO|nr:hypothetical protein LTR24_000421 [Lithohypha guttulata]KAK5320409.1 hypothetical protein LTR70_004491 [Exophiala xenobiotica]
MTNHSLPPKPPPACALPSMRDAKFANTLPSMPGNLPSNVFFAKAAPSKKNTNTPYKKEKKGIAKASKKQLNNQSRATENYDNEAQPGQKRKARDGDQFVPKSTEKRIRTPINPSPHISGLPLAPQGPLPIAYPFFRSFGNPATGHGYFAPPTSAPLRWDKGINHFVAKDPHDKPNSQLPEPASKVAGSIIEACNVSKSRKRPAPDADAVEGNAGNPSKRARSDDSDVEEGEITLPTNTSMSEIVKANKKKKKHRPHAKSKPKSEVALNMRDCDLIPHYRPDSEVLARAKAKEVEKPPPVQFMDLPPEVRLNIWDKVFEDESYSFKLKKKCGNRDDKKFMHATLPRSWDCLFISLALKAEVKTQMYKSMRLEIDFGRLRPHAMRDFMKTIAQHQLGQTAERIFFIKKFGLQKVNLGLFQKAREIVSTGWTVKGDNKMDDDDYKNNRIDPQFILVSPASKDKLKGLKERRYWRDQEAASQRYQRHIEGWCHPDAKNPNAEGYHPETDKKKCPFRDECLKLGEYESIVGEDEYRKRKTKFCMVVKYKFGTIKGRHARHKEAFYDFYPAQKGQDERIVQTVAPKSKFHKKCNKGACKEQSG